MSAITLSSTRTALRSIMPQDNNAVAAIIRTVLTEFGCAREGFAICDPELDTLSDAYALPGSAYFVIEHEGTVVGGGGIAPLKGGEDDVCELQKYYLLSDYRGYGYGRALLDSCLTKAKELGYKRCYIETVTHMDKAVSLYTRAGFRPIPGPMGDTGHHACNSWYLKAL